MSVAHDARKRIAERRASRTRGEDVKPGQSGGQTATAADVRLGKDVLELVSSAMYVDPLVVFREYVQNAADAIDEARGRGLIAPDERGRIDIAIDERARSVRVRDDGAALDPELFAARMLALGGSAKRGTRARGFRGVGRLASLGYARELAFRSRAPGQEDVSEAIWDGRRLKAALADPSVEGVADFIAAVVQVSRVPTRADDPDRFFEVELRGVVRSKGDKLLDRGAVADYLSQVAPVPFDAGFSYGAEIAAAIRSAAPLDEIDISINGAAPLTRPHRDAIPLGDGRSSEVEGITYLEIPRTDGGVAAVAWFAHHGYEGAIPSAALAKGVRLRVGNLQVGGNAMLEDIVPEQRFNSWSVGEVHVLDPRIVPNGRRDEFERNGHLDNLLNHLSPVARDIARRCRNSSAQRSRLRTHLAARAEAEQRIGVLEQGGLPAAARDAERAKANAAIAAAERSCAFDLLDAEDARGAQAALAALSERLATVSNAVSPGDPLDALPAEDRPRYREMIGLIYECSANRVAAKALVERILARIVAGAPGVADGANGPSRPLPSIP